MIHNVLDSLMSYEENGISLSGMTYMGAKEASRQVVNGLLYYMTLEFRAPSTHCNPASGLIGCAGPIQKFVSVKVLEETASAGGAYELLVATEVSWQDSSSTSSSSVNSGSNLRGSRSSSS